jgi:hypothetical protein
VEGTTTVVAEFARCYLVPKSNHSKEKERKYKKREGGMIHPSPLQGLTREGLERGKGFWK